VDRRHRRPQRGRAPGGGAVMIVLFLVLGLKIVGDGIAGL
jgi:hypothetical protein